MDLGYGWLNLCSLILGLLAWFLPIFPMFLYLKALLKDFARHAHA